MHDSLGSGRWRVIIIIIFVQRVRLVIAWPTLIVASHTLEQPFLLILGCNIEESECRSDACSGADLRLCELCLTGGRVLCRSMFQGLIDFKSRENNDHHNSYTYFSPSQRSSYLTRAFPRSGQTGRDRCWVARTRQRTRLSTMSQAEAAVDKI
jgi:hypothetical protein